MGGNQGNWIMLAHWFAILVISYLRGCGCGVFGVCRLPSPCKTFALSAANKFPSLLIRVSRYFGHLLRRKNATGWAHGKGEPTSIGQARRHLIDLFTQDGQISIEDAVVE